MKTIEQIAALHWQDGTAQSDLEAWLLPVLEATPEPGISTSDLMRRIGAKTAWMKGLSSQMGMWRKDNPDYVTLQARPGAFGKPAYLWHSAKPKPSMTQDQRRTWLKENDPETYALLYGADDAGQ